MKTGKQFKLNLNPNFRTYYGSVDYKKPKSIYINIASWFSPLEEEENWERVVGQLKRQIKYNITDVPITEYFLSNKQIVDLDIRTSGIRKNKRSYMNCEITLFLKKEEDIKSNGIKSLVKNLLGDIISKTLTPSKKFNFYLTKK
jgi:hypothetical protein|tara:strand:+ start:61 stop:492 length:432 start_codon:yes stop_codon:yes gene_type:complete